MARYIVVSYVKAVVVDMRNLYWLREIQAQDDSPDLKLLRPLRIDAQSLVEITRSREIGIPTVLIGALLIRSRRRSTGSRPALHSRAGSRR